MIPLIDLAPGYSIPRLILGGWQLSAGHSGRLVDPTTAFDEWDHWLDRGANTFDCADIYTGVEALIGDYIRRRRARGQAPPQVHTKFVPDLAALPTLDRRYVGQVIDRSLRRLGLERLDLVQFHWWDYEVPGAVEALHWLDDLRRDGKIRLIGLTNFDTSHLDRLLATGVSIASLQLQYSVLDQRPARGLARRAAANDVGLLCYGTLAGGFLSERWLGAVAPTRPANRSLVKYGLVIEDGGGWLWFQGVLRALRAVADRHGVDLATVALRWVLDREGVTAAIVGIRPGGRLEDLAAAMQIRLSDDDEHLIRSATGPSPGPEGDVYAAERVRGGRHAAIMRYDLNRDPV